MDLADIKIGVAGCGALGGYYGARLLKDRRRVFFLVRSGLEDIRRRGVSVASPEGDFNVRPRAASTPEEIGVCDLVIIGLKTTANHVFPHWLPPLTGPDTVVLTLQNGLGNEEQLARIVPAERIVGGLCFVCVNRTAPGQIHHIAYGRIDLGEFSGWPLPRTHEIARLFQHAGVPCHVAANLIKARWIKLLWNIPFNGLCVAGAAGESAFSESGDHPVRAVQTGLTTDRLLASEFWTRKLRGLMDEILEAANRKGLDIDPSIPGKLIQRTRSMGAYQPSSLIDFRCKRPLELEAMFREPLRQAKAAGVEAPLLERLNEILTGLDEENGKGADDSRRW